MTIPNLISLFRLVAVIPVATYFFLIGENWVALGVSIVFYLLDILDGYLARRLKQETELGEILDVSVDTAFFAMLLAIFLYLGHIDLLIIAFIGAHRFTRYLLNIYTKFYAKTYYNPFHLKIIGWIPLIYFFLIPVFVENFGRTATYLATWIVLAGTYVPLLVSVVIAIIQFKKGKRLQ